MPDINLELSDAVELAELLTFLADWLSGSQQQTLNDSLTTFVGHPAYDVDNLAADLDCRLESACETCAYFRTGTQFLPILTRQRDHARDHGQAGWAALFDGLIQRAETGPATTERS